MDAGADFKRFKGVHFDVYAATFLDSDITHRAKSEVDPLPVARTAMGRKHTALNPAAASSSSSKNGHSRVSQQGRLSRTPSSVRSSSFKRDHAHKNVKWSEADEAKLTRLVQEHPDARWRRIAELMVMGSRSAPRTAQAVAQKHKCLTQVQRAQMAAAAAAAAARPMPSSSSSSKVNLRWMWDVGLCLR